jgi:hypothetical protein
MRKRGAIDALDELRVANVLWTASELDNVPAEASPAMRASMCRAHLAACKALFGGEPEQEDVATTELLAFLQSPDWLKPPVYDPSGDGSGYWTEDRPPGWRNGDG